MLTSLYRLLLLLLVRRGPIEFSFGKKSLNSLDILSGPHNDIALLGVALDLDVKDGDLTIA